MGGDPGLLGPVGAVHARGRGAGEPEPTQWQHVAGGRDTAGEGERLLGAGKGGQPFAPRGPGSTRPGLPLRRATPDISSCPAELCAEAWGAWAVRYLSVDRTLTEEQKGVSEIPRGAPSPN